MFQLLTDSGRITPTNRLEAPDGRDRDWDRVSLRRRRVALQSDEVGVHVGQRRRPRLLEHDRLERPVPCPSRWTTAPQNCQPDGMTRGGPTPKTRTFQSAARWSPCLHWTRPRSPRLWTAAEAHGAITHRLDQAAFSPNACVLPRWRRTRYSVSSSVRSMSYSTKRRRTGFSAKANGVVDCIRCMSKSTAEIILKRMQSRGTPSEPCAFYACECEGMHAPQLGKVDQVAVAQKGWVLVVDRGHVRKEDACPCASPQVNHKVRNEERPVTFPWPITHQSTGTSGLWPS